MRRTSPDREMFISSKSLSLLFHRRTDEGVFFFKWNVFRIYIFWFTGALQNLTYFQPSTDWCCGNEDWPRGSVFTQHFEYAGKLMIVSIIIMKVLVLVVIVHFKNIKSVSVIANQTSIEQVQLTLIRANAVGRASDILRKRISCKGDVFNGTHMWRGVQWMMNESVKT